MNKPIRIDINNNLIIMNANFSKRALQYGTSESEELTRAKRDYPNYKVIVRQIKKNPDKETYQGLTYDYMRRYIRKFETAERAAAMLKELEDLQFIAQCHAKARRYPAIKRWFLENYPKVAEFGVQPLEENEIAKAA